MKSMQVFFVCALIVVCSASPIPDEAASIPTTAASTAEKAEKTEISTPSAKSPEIPAVNVPVTDAPAAKSDIPEPQALPSKAEDNLKPKPEEKNLEPQALPSKTEDNSTPKPEEKKREIANEASSELPIQNAEQPKAEEIPTPSTSEKPKTEEKPAESVKSLTPESVQVPAQASEVQTEPKQAVSLVESTVLPAAIASEKKIDAEAPAPIVSENVQAAQQSSVPVEQALKSEPAASSLPVEPSSAPSVESSSSEKKDSDSSSSEDSSEESKEDKKTA